MKKKKTITLIAACMALFAGTQTSLAQNGVLLPENQVDTRRGDAIPATPSTWIGYIKLADNVNNEFGAGESSTINSGSISWPASNGLKNPPEIQLGSDYSQNIVINSYNGHGYASGVIKFTVGGVSASTRTVTPSKYTTWKDYTADTYPGWAFPGGTEVFGDELNVVHEGTGNPTGNMTPEISYGHTDMGAVKGIYYSFATTKNSPDAGGSYETNTVDIYLMNHDAAQSLYSFTGGHWQTKATSGLTPYTSTVDAGVDDGVDLFQFDGDSAVRTTADIKDAPTVGNNKLKPYVRPTTIALNGNNEFEQINFKTIEWQYRYHNIKNAPSVSTWYNIGSTVNIFNDDIRGGCGCHDEMKFQTTSISGEWDYTTEPGNTKVDAAVQLLNGSDVCVSGSVTDATGNIGSKNSDDATYVKTNALVVYPGANGNARLRTLGDFKANMDNEPNALTANALYSHKDFPDANASIFLMEGDKTFDFGVGGLTATYDGQVDNINIVKAPISTISSIFGVNGKYDYVANMALVHTSKFNSPSDSSATIATSKKDDNRGVIEVGENTAAQIGADKFYIYSGGILKNFESCDGPNSNFTVNVGNGSLAPTFTLDGIEPLYIMNYGNNGSDACAADLNFGTKGIANLVSAFGAASEKGALHIQARGDVMFKSTFSPLVSKQNNELRILSDEASIQFKGAFEYVNNKDSNLVIWAQGKAGDRSCPNETCTGFVYFAQTASIQQDTKGISLVRSEKSNVLMDNTFEYNNKKGPDNAFGEFIMQAGQDIYGKGAVAVTQTGNRPVLFEAKQSVHFANTLTFDRTSAMNGASVIKAGYSNFSKSADVKDWTAPDWCTGNDYSHRDDCYKYDGGDIWFEGEVKSINTTDNDSVSTIFRAWNSIYVDDALTYTRAKKSVRDSIAFLMFAETGNIEAIKPVGKVIITTSKADDTTTIRLQAGNQVSDMTLLDDTLSATNGLCSGSGCYVTEEKLHHFDGNILFNKTLDIEHSSLGHTLISASRDIENDQNGNFIFNYNNSKAVLPFYMTAGRHIETHAPVEFTYVADTANITLEAGRMDGNLGCSEIQCKEDELGSNLSTAVFTDNEMSEDGAGNGSILMFAPMSFDHTSNGFIYMKALNGNIESDPYLHGSYRVGAPLLFSHKGTGITKMRAIDIKLHDIMSYEVASTAADLKNGQFYMMAYDSILTRNISYKNTTDTGSVFITTDKIKTIDNAYYCEETIRQGHIVLGYGADCNRTDDKKNSNDSIIFDYESNTSTVGANILIEAGAAGFKNRTDYKKNLYGGNITFDYMLIKPATGNRTASGYTKIHTPNGNIWGKDSITYIGHKGDLLVDAGLGSADDNEAIRWNASGARGTAMQTNGHLGEITNAFPNGSENTLNTRIPNNCNGNFEWRTGNIMMKGGSLTYPTNEGGYATFRTRAGYIDLYDKFDVTGMTGQLLVYAHSDAVENDTIKQYSDVSTRDFHYEPSPSGASVYFGADDNIMFNYGNSNGTQDYTPDVPCAATSTYAYDYDGHRNNLHDTFNPFYSTSYKKNIDECRSIFNVNTNGYQWYNQWSPDDLLGDGDPYIWKNHLHMLYRGGRRSCNNSGIAGTCETPSNGARDIEMNFSSQQTGGFAAVANNYIDFFTKLTYNGGQGHGLENPSVGSIVGENVSGYGLYLKSRYQGTQPERRRITCFMCSPEEWPYVGFHDDARIHTENQKSLIEGPVIEFFGHAELDSYTQNNGNGKITLKGDSLIFHDSAIFDGTNLELVPFTTAGRGMRHGIVNDVNIDFYKEAYRQAITMTDRMLPVIELGYQRCNEPLSSPNKAPNTRSDLGKEEVPTVGGDVIVAVKDGYKLPIFNTVVANHARISFVSDSLDHKGNVYLNAFVRTDLLRIRNKVEFYTGEGTGNNEPKNRVGHFEMTSTDQMVKPSFDKSGMYPKHLHMEPGSELSIPGENTLTAIGTTTIGGYGEIHENVYIKANGTIAPGHSSLMEQDCTSGRNPGMLKVHNLVMDKDAEFRISLGDQTGNNSTGVDTLYVEDTIIFNGKIPLYVLTDVKSIETGCYTFLIYNDKDGVSKEYVKNLVLKIDRYEDNYFSLNYSTPGEVKLCVSKSPNPVVQQYVELPVVDGVTLTPYTGGKHYVVSQQNFTFYATYTGAPLKVMGDGVYDGKHVEILGEKQSDGSYKYVLTYVVEPWTVTIGPEFATNFVGNEVIEGNQVWAYKNMLYVNVSESDIASIYTMTGVLYKRVELPEGNSKFTLDKGMYIVTLKDGSVHKIVIK